MIAGLINTLWEIIGFLQMYNGAVTAVATVFIGVFTWVLACVTGRQARLTRASIELVRNEFISTHRPRIILRDVCMGSGREVFYMLVNRGGTKATVVESWILAERIPPGQFIRPCISVRLILE
jgi:hypothetical protein